MNNPIHRLSELSFKYLKEELNESETIELEEFLNQSNENRQFFNDLINRDRINENLQKIYQTDSVAIWDNVVKANPKLKKGSVVSIFRPTLKYAAAVIFIAALGGYWLFNRNKQTKVAQTQTTIQPAINDVSPGQFKAKLTLSDGSTVTLDSFSNKRLVQQGGTNVYIKDSQLVYQLQGKQNNKVLYNTLTTAKGEIYATVLSDGSKVWLNSQSSIRYPVAFNSVIRKVEITGEADFEVTSSILETERGQKIKRPFIVTVNGMDVEVLGTHFNINAYNDEGEIKTTLLEGKVKVTKDGEQAMLVPGQQARLNKQTQQLSKVNDVDVDEAVAWRYGYFQFNQADLQAVLRQLIRWYNVDVIYQGNIPQRSFGGKISRQNSLAQILQILESNGVHFEIKGKKIVVSP